MLSNSPLKLCTLICCVQLLTACASQNGQTNAPQPQADNYAPGLGEFMTQISDRHLKLWYAGNHENWQLADYELEEIHEGLDDLAKFHTTHEKIKGSIPDMIAAHLKPALEQTAAAIKAKNIEQFRASYDSITAGCNSCHQANDFGFNVIQRPFGNPFTNQSFGVSP